MSEGSPRSTLSLIRPHPLSPPSALPRSVQYQGIYMHLGWSAASSVIQLFLQLFWPHAPSDFLDHLCTLHDGLTYLNFSLSVCLFVCTLSGLEQKSHYKRYHVFFSERRITANVKLLVYKQCQDQWSDTVPYFNILGSVWKPYNRTQCTVVQTVTFIGFGFKNPANLGLHFVKL